MIRVHFSAIRIKQNKITELCYPIDSKQKLHKLSPETKQNQSPNAFDSLKQRNLSTAEKYNRIIEVTIQAYNLPFSPSRIFNIWTAYGHHSSSPRSQD